MEKFSGICVLEYRPLDILKIVNLTPFSPDPSFPGEGEEIYRLVCGN